ncbi:MAG: transcriptional regulator, MarR family [Ilumatobacteraceae bacterium]|nr:transcriptional regulator, MarR family [Ilumatobacteraceae bacterium]
MPLLQDPTVADRGVAAPVDPRDLAQHLRLSIARLARLLRQQDRNAHGPTLTAALASVALLDGPTHGELAAREQVAPPTITAVVTKMEALGLVTRETDANDRRVTRIRITAAGLAELDDVRSRRNRWLEQQMLDLSPDELARLAAAADVLAKITAAPESNVDVRGSR